MKSNKVHITFTNPHKIGHYSYECIKDTVKDKQFLKMVIIIKNMMRRMSVMIEYLEISHISTFNTN